MADLKSVEMKPYLRQGEALIAGVMNGDSNMFAKDYHHLRDGLLKLRSADPATGALYDKYLTDVVKGGKDWAPEQIKKLKEGFQKQNVGFSSVLNEVALDLKAHNYDKAYRPAVMVGVNGRPMDPEVVVRELKSAGVAVESDIPRSIAAGKVSNSGLVVKQGSLVQGLDEVAGKLSRADDIERKLGRNSATVFAQVTEHAGGLFKLAKHAPVVGKVLGVFGAIAGVSGAMAAPTPAERNEKLLKEGAGLIDPTGGILSEGIPLAIKDIRENGARRAQEARINPHNLAITRQEDFLLSTEHPGQLGALKINDAKGNPLDVAKLLKDPAGQKLVLAEIDKREDKATSPASKEIFESMKEAAQEFIALESRRKVIAPAAPTTTVAQVVPARELAVSPS